jgi:hypothetical protein
LGLANLKLLGTALGLKRLQITMRQSVGIFAENGRPTKGEPMKQWAGSMMQRAAAPFEFIQRPDLGFRLPVPKPQKALLLTLKFLRSLVPEEKLGETYKK